MKPVYCISTNTCCPIGLNTDEAWNALSAGESGICFLQDTALYPKGTWASRIPERQWERIGQAVAPDGLSALEQMAIFSAKGALSLCPVSPDLSRTLFVLTTTKGNIEYLGIPGYRSRLSSIGNVIGSALGIPGRPVVISQACVSGVAGLIYATRALQTGRFEHAVIVGADRLSGFVLSGFDSFKALAREHCRPFDAARKGINLGEAAATIVLSINPGDAPLARLSGGATSNDANHISGPSRTGEELGRAINSSLHEAGIAASEIDVISAHGTATIYNDEMESMAFGRAGLLSPPVHSLKAVLGHTLGAAGVLESALLIESMQRDRTIASAGFETLGVSQAINVRNESISMPIHHALKTASGFGGCNAAIVWSKLAVGGKG